jgi:hypothetical protein
MQSFRQKWWGPDARAKLDGHTGERIPTSVTNSGCTVGFTLPLQMPQCVVGRMDASQWGAACQKVDAAIVSHKATFKSTFLKQVVVLVLLMLVSGFVMGVMWPSTGEHVGACAALCAKIKSFHHVRVPETCSAQTVIPQWTEGCEASKLFCFPTDTSWESTCKSPLISTSPTCQSGCCYYNDEKSDVGISAVFQRWTFPAFIIAMAVGLVQWHKRSQAAMDHALGELNQTVFGPAGFRATFYAGTKNDPAAVFLQDLTGGQGGIQMQPMGAMPATQVQSVQQGGVMPQAGVVMAAPVQAPPVLMSVTVPDGMQAGQMLMIMTLAGTQMQVQIPASVSPGQAFQVQAPAAAPVQNISAVQATRAAV